MKLWQEIILHVGIIGAGAMLATLMVMFFAKKATPIIEWTRKHKLEAIWVAPFVIACVLTGSTKEMWGRVEYPYTDVETRYLIDAGSYVTNGYAHVAFSRLPIVPASAPLMIAVRPTCSTNDLDWVLIVDTTFDGFNQPQDVVYAGAETNVFQVFTTWTPGPAVHTNGVAVVEWQRPMRGSIHELVTKRTGIYENGIRIAPNPGLTNGPAGSVWMTVAPQEENGGNEE